MRLQSKIQGRRVHISILVRLGKTNLKFSLQTSYDSDSGSRYSRDNTAGYISEKDLAELAETLSPEFRQMRNEEKEELKGQATFNRGVFSQNSGPQNLV